jgi:hypothetical protein
MTMELVLRQRPESRPEKRNGAVAPPGPRRSPGNGPLLRRLFLILLVLVAAPAIAETYLLRPARVFDGIDPRPHEGWSVLVQGDRIAAAGRGRVDLLRRKLRRGWKVTLLEMQQES